MNPGRRLGQVVIVVMLACFGIGILLGALVVTWFVKGLQLSAW